MVLFDEAVQVLGVTALRWAGVPPTEDLPRRAAQLAAVVAGFAQPGRAYLRAVAARVVVGRWAGVGLYVGLSGLASVNDRLSVAVALAGAALTAGGVGYERSGTARDELRGHDPFYQYEVDRRLSR